MSLRLCGLIAALVIASIAPAAATIAAPQIVTCTNTNSCSISPPANNDTVVIVTGGLSTNCGFAITDSNSTTVTRLTNQSSGSASCGSAYSYKVTGSPNGAYGEAQNVDWVIYELSGADSTTASATGTWTNPGTSITTPTIATVSAGGFLGCVGASDGFSGVSLSASFGALTTDFTQSTIVEFAHQLNSSAVTSASCTWGTNSSSTDMALVIVAVSAAVSTGLSNQQQVIFDDQLFWRLALGPKARS